MQVPVRALVQVAVLWAVVQVAVEEAEVVAPVVEVLVVQKRVEDSEGAVEGAAAMAEEIVTDTFCK